MTELVVYARGEYVPESEASVPVLDHGFLYGDGVWDGMRVYGGKVFKLEEHLERLYDLAQVCAIEIPMSAEEMKSIIVELLERNGHPDHAYVRPIVTRGMGPNPPGITSDGCQPDVYILFHSWEGAFQGALRLRISSFRRRAPDCLPVAKTLCFMDSTLARIEARRAGADAGLLLDVEGNIAESDGNNFFLTKHGEVLTPPTRYVLPGITRKVAMEIAKALGIPVMEKDLAPSDAYAADEAFLTSTGAGIVPVESIDGRVLRHGSPGPITTQIMEEFERMVWS
jgi:branched-chain amino acid aminotransferase